MSAKRAQRRAGSLSYSERRSRHVNIMLLVMNLYSSVCLFALSGLFAIAPALAQRSLGNVTVQATPVAIAVDKTHNKIYVSNDNATPVLTVIDGATNVVSTIGTTPSGATAGAIAYSAFSDRIYRANVLSGGTTWGISRITFTPSLASLQISVPEAPQSIIIDESNGNAWVLGTSHAYLLLATGSSTTTTATVTVGNGPAAIAIADNDVGGDRRVYVANKTDGTVTRIATQNTATVYTVTVGANPQAIAVNQLTKKIYVANGGSGTVTVIDGPTAIGGSIGTSTVSVGTNPVSIAVNEATNKVYVVNAGDNSVTVLNGAAAGFGTTASVAATITNGNTTRSQPSMETATSRSITQPA
jgi:YVTN family beta-propeller protein